MKKNIILTIAFSTIILAACQSKQKTDSSVIHEPLTEEMSSDLNSNSINKKEKISVETDTINIIVKDKKQTRE